MSEEKQTKHRVFISYHHENDQCRTIPYSEQYKQKIYPDSSWFSIETKRHMMGDINILQKESQTT